MESAGVFVEMGHNEERFGGFSMATARDNGPVSNLDGDSPAGRLAWFAAGSEISIMTVGAGTGLICSDSEVVHDADAPGSLSGAEPHVG